MPNHPFLPQIFPSTRKLLIGSLPPEGVSFYFSNSPNTRLWDILDAIASNQPTVGKGGYLFPTAKKLELLDQLGVGLCDIIQAYERENDNSTRDLDIIPLQYFDILEIAYNNDINELLFVYESALKWFLHSLRDEPPIRLNALNKALNYEPQIEYRSRLFNLRLLPSPLSRGRKGETLLFKLEAYRNSILNMP